MLRDIPQDPMSAVRTYGSRREAVLHDIRNELTVIVGFADVLARRVHHPDPAPAEPGWLADRLARILSAGHQVISQLSELEALGTAEGRADGDALGDVRVAHE